MSLLEMVLAQDIRAAGLPAPVTEQELIPGRKFRTDFAWPAYRIALEVDGGTWQMGRHQRPQGFAADCVKRNSLAVMGWLVLNVTGDMVSSKEALHWVERALAARGWTREHEEVGA